MMNCFKSHSFAIAVYMVAAAFGLIALGGCSATVDPTLGYEILPENQMMVMRHLTFKGDKVIRFDGNSQEWHDSEGHFFETTMYRLDSLQVNNLLQTFMGVEHSNRFGRRSSGFATNFVYYNHFTGDAATEGFGYKPVFDTLALVLTVGDYGVDTLTPINYTVYELTKPLLENTDSVVYMGSADFEEMYDATKPLFTFTYPDGETTGPKTAIVNLTPVDLSTSSATWDFVRRLMLLPEDMGDWDGYANVGLENYGDSVKFVKAFPGIYIKPDDYQPAFTSGKDSLGALYSINLSASGLSLQLRNRNPQDPTLIKDTVGMDYIFLDETMGVGNMSVNDIRHNLDETTVPLTGGATLANIDFEASVPLEERTKVETALIEGVGGPVMVLHLTDDFISELKKITTEFESEEFSHAGLNQCLISFYVEGADYDPFVTQGNALTLTPLLDASPTRLGIYTDYNNMKNIADYDYVAENTYNVTLNYGGTLNRSRACYMMNITTYMQQLINYVSTLEADDNGHYTFDETDSKYVARTLYVGYEAGSYFSLRRTLVQGAAPTTSSESRAPINLELTYTLIK